MDNQTKDNIELLLDKGSDYFSTRIDLYKLKAVDTSSDLLSAIISKVIVFSVFIVFFLIANIGIALLLGELLGKLYYGFFIVAGHYLIAGIVIKIMQKQWLKEPLADKLIEKLLK